jgi:DivIVA domain-containing protein
MAITPQAIKDQEFQVKFRGYDTVEVKAYLDLIAEEFFELLEQVRQQIDELDVIVAERDVLQGQKVALEVDVIASRGSSEEIQSEFAARDSEAASLQDQIAAMKMKIKSLEREKKTRDDGLSGVESQVLQKEEAVLAEKKRNDKLSSRIDSLMKENEGLRKEEIDFKSTLVAAQQFTNEVKRKSEKEAKEVLEKAKAHAGKLRQETFDELAGYPAEIKRLKQKRTQVREDLETVLKLSLESLEIFVEDDEEMGDDYGELFQKIKLNKNGLPEGDELDAINMDFDLPGSDGVSLEDGFSMKDEMKS